MARRGMSFGIFLAPFHRAGGNPTLALERDIEMITWLDHSGDDETRIGEHHSANWENIAPTRMPAGPEARRHVRAPGARDAPPVDTVQKPG